MKWKTCRDNLCAFILCVAFYFVSIAIVLGSGVLALPVSVGECGFLPFLVTFVIGYIAQIYVLSLMLDLLQITEQAQFLEQERRKKGSEDFQEDDIDKELEDIELSANEKSNESFKLSTEHEEIVIEVTDEVVREEKSQNSPVYTSENQFEEKTEPNIEDDEEIIVEEVDPTSNKLFLKKDEDETIQGDQVGILDTTEEKVVSHKNPLIKPTEEENEDDDVENIKFISTGPDLYSMGKMFIPVQIRWLYDVAIVINFISILTSYALAGPQCIGKFINYMGFLKNTDFPLYYFIILPFVCIFSMIVIFGARCIAFIITFFTIFKGSALTFVLLLTGIVTLSANNEDKVGQHWDAVLSPFLIGTVALSGIFSIMPVVYCRLPLGERDITTKKNKSDNVYRKSKSPKINSNNEEKDENKCFSITDRLCYLFCACTPICDRRAFYLRMFRIAAILGLTTVTSLNIIWVIEVLILVPSGELENARKNELISTVPLMDAIRGTSPKYDWISYIIDTFVLLSVSVSFICEGSGFKHYIDGIIRYGMKVKRIDPDREYDEDDENDQKELKEEIYSKSSFLIRPILKLQVKFSSLRKLNPRAIVQWILYILVFSTVYGIAQLNPKTFFLVMEIFNSFAGNLMCGFFLCMMLFNAYRKHIWGKESDRVNMFISSSKWTLVMMIPLFLYFVVAIVYDMIKGGVEVILFFVNNFGDSSIKNPF